MGFQPIPHVLIVRYAGPRSEHSKALPPGPIEAYVPRYVAGSAPRASNAARRCLLDRH